MCNQKNYKTKKKHVPNLEEPSAEQVETVVAQNPEINLFNQALS